MPNLFKIKDAERDFLNKAKKEGRLVYVPSGKASDLRLCKTIPKYKPHYDLVQRGFARDFNLGILIHRGELFYNISESRPCDGRPLTRVQTNYEK